MTERMGIALENLFQKSDEAMEECILYDDVQESLKNQGLEAVNTIALSKYFAYIDLDHVADYCYIDNKGNVYSKSYSDVTSETIAQSGFEDYLGPEYSRTKWFWAKDTLFGTGDERCLSDGMYAAWIMPMNRGCFSLRWRTAFWTRSRE